MKDRYTLLLIHLPVPVDDGRQSEAHKMQRHSTEERFAIGVALPQPIFNLQ
jgi:hypothetical protein